MLDDLAAAIYAWGGLRLLWLVPAWMASERAGPTAAMLAVGSELLKLGRADTNSPLHRARAAAHGIAVAFTTVVGDERTTSRGAGPRARAGRPGGVHRRPGADRRRPHACRRGCGARPARCTKTQSCVARIRAALRRRGADHARDQSPAGAGARGRRRDRRIARGTAPGLWIPAGDAGINAAARAAARDDADARPRRRTARRAALGRAASRGAAGGDRRRAAASRGSTSSVQPIYGPWRAETPPIAHHRCWPAWASSKLHLSAAGGDAGELDARLDARRAGARRARLAPTW